MTAPERPTRLLPQLRALLVLADARPAGWVASTVGASLVLAALDTLGIAAMIPLTQLITGTDTDTGVLGGISDFTGRSTAQELIPARRRHRRRPVRRQERRGARVPLVAARAHHPCLGHSRAAELMRRYVLAPYADHRTRRLSEVYRNITTRHGAGHRRAARDDQHVHRILMMLVAITAVLAITAPLVTLLTVVVFGVVRLRPAADLARAAVSDR